MKQITNHREKHGYHGTREYRLWARIKQRCYNVNHTSYKDYGAKDVTMCDLWINNPEEFCKWALLNGSKKGLEIDKDILSNELGIFPHIYSPKTCQFVTKSVNVRVTKQLQSNNTSGYRGVSRSSAGRERWTSNIIVNSKTIYLGSWSTKILAAKAYDYYVKTNSLEHTVNKVLGKDEIVCMNTERDTESISKFLGIESVFKKKIGKYVYLVRLKDESGKRFTVGKYSTPLEAAIARDKYISENNLMIKKSIGSAK